MKERKKEDIHNYTEKEDLSNEIINFHEKLKA